MLLKTWKKLREGLGKEYIDAMSDAGTIGLQMVTCTFIGLLMGYFLDKWFNTKPTLTLVFLILGIIAGFRSVYFETKKLRKKQYGSETKKDPSND